MAEDTLEFEYILTVPFEYAAKGSTVKAQFITLKAPTSRHLAECATLEQAFLRAAASSRDPDAEAPEAKDDETPEIKGSDILTLMAISKDVDFPGVLLTAKKLFLSPGVAFVDGEAQLKAASMDKMSLNDLKGMLGEYLVNFTLASSLEKTID